MPLNETEMAAYGRLKLMTLNTGTKTAGTADNWTGACIFRKVAGGTEILPLDSEGVFRSGQDQSSVEQWVKDATKDWPKSRKDSEAKALAYLGIEYDRQLRLKSGNWNFALYSLNGPCKSCKNVIKKFTKYYTEELGNNNLYGLIIYKNSKHQVPPSNIWPNGCLYGYGDEIEDENGFFYKKIVISNS